MLLPQRARCILYAHAQCRLYFLPLQGNVTISNDGATIMKKLEIVHPAAKTLVDISLSQDAEVRTCWSDPR